MSFFDNWRVQLASLNKYNNETEKEISNYETKYETANELEKKNIFDIYSEQTNRIQTNLVTNLHSVGNILEAMWAWTCQKYPHLSIINDNDTKHSILQCRTESEQDAIFNEWLNKKN